MRFLYLLGIWALYAAMAIASPFHPKAGKWIRGRRNPSWKTQPSPNKPVYWFHCASLGEFDQGLPVMNALKEKEPGIHLLVTFFSPSGMDAWQKRQNQVDEVVYLPIDTPRKAKAFIRHYQPEKVFFIKYEIWYNHLKAASEAGAKIYGVSSMFRPNQRFFKWYGGLFREALKLFTRFFVQNEASQRLLSGIGIRNVTISGDTRYDRMMSVVRNNTGNDLLAQFKGNEPMLILGSSWPEEEKLFIAEQTAICAKYKVLIAPHDVSEAHISAISKQLSVSRTAYTTGVDSAARVLVLDTIGQLTAAYRYADVAFVGGGFSGKLHNILEPGAFGVPVIFGPKHARFPEAQLFLDRGVAREITEDSRLSERVDTLFEQQEIIRAELEKIFAENEGAAAVIVNNL